MSNCHIHAIRHIRHLLTTELALTLACTLMLSRLDYCIAVLHGAPAGSIQKLQRIQNTAACIILQVPRQSSAQPLLEQLHWLPVRQRLDNLQFLHTNSTVHPHHHTSAITSTSGICSSPPLFRCTATVQANYQIPLCWSCFSLCSTHLLEL